MKPSTDDTDNRQASRSQRRNQAEGRRAHEEPNLEADGRAENNAGKVQNVVGKIEKAVGA